MEREEILRKIRERESYWLYRRQRDKIDKDEEILALKKQLQDCDNKSK